MKKLLYIFAVIVLSSATSHAQSTAMQFSGLDCNGNTVDLFSDLDSGKAVALIYYMPSCGTCPPVATKIQAMADNINATFPGKVKGYAYPYQNSTTCSYSSTWVSSNSLSSIFAPMDSGTAQVAYYGGFGMPTVVLLGGTGHRVMFVTQSFTTGDTTIMHDSIINMLNAQTGIGPDLNQHQDFQLYPNPASDEVAVQIQLNQKTDVQIEILDLSGKTVMATADDMQSGLFSRKIRTDRLQSGIYYVKLGSNERTAVRKLAVVH